MFPIDAQLPYQTSTRLSNPDAYNTLATDTMRTDAADFATGGTPTSDAAAVASLACGNVNCYDCAVLNSDGSTRNCDAIGTGSRSIETVGDAPAMHSAGVSADAASLTYKRFFVERDGKVYFSYCDERRGDNAARRNAQGMDALFAQLGLSR